jgi:hypothetical protein
MTTEGRYTLTDFEAEGGPFAVMLDKGELWAYATWTPRDMSTLLRAVMKSDTQAYLEPINGISLDSMPNGHYTIGTEPMWVTDRILALSITDIPPPPHPIEGIGMRIDETTYWIVAPEKGK